MEDRIKGLLNNESFLNKIKGCKSADEFLNILREYDVDINSEQAEEAYKAFISGTQEADSNKELNEAELLSVSGGKGAPRGIFYWLGYGVGRLLSKKTGVCH